MKQYDGVYGVGQLVFQAEGKCLFVKNIKLLFLTRCKLDNFLALSSQAEYCHDFSSPKTIPFPTAWNPPSGVNRTAPAWTSWKT